MEGGVWWRVVEAEASLCTLLLEKEENARKEARGTWWTAGGMSRDHIVAFVVVLNCFGGLVSTFTRLSSRHI